MYLGIFLIMVALALALLVVVREHKKLHAEIYTLREHCRRLESWLNIPPLEENGKPRFTSRQKAAIKRAYKDE